MDISGAECEECGKLIPVGIPGGPIHAKDCSHYDPNAWKADPIDEIIKEATNPDNYADNDLHITVLYGMIVGLAEEVKRLRDVR